jgi:hypothetical protein
VECRRGVPVEVTENSENNPRSGFAVNRYQRGIKCASDKIVIELLKTPECGCGFPHSTQAVFSLPFLFLSTLTNYLYIQLSSTHKSLPCHFFPPDIKVQTLSIPSASLLGLSLSHATCSLPHESFLPTWDAICNFVRNSGYLLLTKRPL